MKTDKITVFDLFERQRRYLVPIFQRGYVWTREGQWEPLWEDIADQARLVQLHKGASGNTIRKHFLGSIVLSQVPTVIRQVPTSEIIDGQQRLLTLQVLLAALRDAVVKLDDDYLKMQLARLTINPEPFHDNNEQFKVWPTNAYHEDLRNIMNAGSAEALTTKYPQRRYYGKLVPPRPSMVDAYLYFYNMIELYAGRRDKDVDTLYNQWWKDYDELSSSTGKFWKEKERQGRFYRSRLDLFFFHYLTYRVGHEIKMSHMYQDFKEWWNSTEQRPVEAELEAAKSSSQVFHSFLVADDDRPLESHLAMRIIAVIRRNLGVLAQRLRILDTTTVYPFLLWLCDHRDKIKPDEFDGILADIESYIVRRAICRLTPKNYNRIFLTLLIKLSKEGLPNRASVHRELLSLEGDSAVWPNDEALKGSLIYEPLYNSIGPRRVRLVLTALELASRTSRQESLPLPINNSLTIEHVMPQRFKPEEWPYPEQESVDKQEQDSRRQTLLHSLGNLTLLTQPLNSEVSNGPFSAKRPEITKQSLLVLNSYFQSFSDDDTWNEDTIIERGKRLAELALKVWTYPRA